MLDQLGGFSYLEAQWPGRLRPPWAAPLAFRVVPVAAAQVAAAVAPAVVAPVAVAAAPVDRVAAQPGALDTSL